MLGRATGAVLVGIDARLVHVEADLGGGLPTLAAVGLADVAVREGLDRIRAALPHAGLKLPQRRIIVNLAPADLRKHGATLDLPMAIAVLEADGQIPPLAAGTLAVGELGLDGTLRPIRGALSMALLARESGLRTLIVPAQNEAEAALVDGIDVRAVATIADVAALAKGEPCLSPPPRQGSPSPEHCAEGNGHGPDLADVRGQATARRALEIAAAGGHNLLLCGPPGSGKSMLARRFPGILPPMTPAEAFEVTRIWSAAGLAHGLVTTRPFRSPHSGISLAGLTGGGAVLRPGELSLATNGVLFLDELPEYQREVLEAIRAPLEDGFVVVTRLRATASFPARFSLIASMNPCACGWHGDPRGRCRCTPKDVSRYRSKLSGPLLDRFDLLVDVPALEIADLTSVPREESSERVRERVVTARRQQQRRFEQMGNGSCACNAQLGPRDLDRFAGLSVPCRRMLESAFRTLDLSARGFDRVRRVARTLADLDQCPNVEERHVAEAIQYRRERQAMPM